MATHFGMNGLSSHLRIQVVNGIHNKQVANTDSFLLIYKVNLETTLGTFLAQKGKMKTRGQHCNTQNPKLGPLNYN